jgi:D-glycero-D-manno-heptose 1,7-bisphosphate phosphatase
MCLRPALFLDRDGVINVDHGYVHRIEEFEFMPGIFELVRVARGQGLAIVVVTNQAGIARGLYSDLDFERLTEWMLGRFAEEAASIDRVYHCPVHPIEGVGRYRVDSPMRKPGPGMLLRARDELGIDLPASVMLGDKASDIEAGRAAGVGLNLLLHSPRYPLQGPCPGARRVVDLSAAAKALLEHCSARFQAQ